MALDLTAEQKEQGRQNFAHATGDLTRRGFMKSMVAAGAVVPVGAAAYFGYTSISKPGEKGAVRTALIGGGDEAGVLMGEHNPEFVDIVAVADIRPYNLDRIFAGEPAPSPRKGLEKVYGKESAKKIEKFRHYDDLLKKDVIDRLGIEAVIVALPLHLHAPCSIKAMELGLHCLCEKLMARDITQCKAMIAAAKKNNVILSIGHQRHYSMLYAHANEVVESGVLGDLKHIRALWHRNNSWPWSPSQAKEPLAVGVRQPDLRDGWYPMIYDRDYQELVTKNKELMRDYDSIEQLVRWRLYDRTGGGLMAELGSHQLDASSIFLGKVKPLSVQGVGGRYFYGDLAKAQKGLPTGPNPRESDDGVFVTFEFPGKNHPKGKNKGADETDIVVLTYSSMNTNSFEKYGECLMGSRGTMVVEEEGDVFLFRESEPGKAGSGGRSTGVTVTTAGGGKPAMEASSTWAVGGGPAVVKTGNASGWGTVSRGYREEMEHFAYCIRKWDKAVGWRKKKDDKGVEKYEQELPRCHGEIAMADAILALTSNMAMDRKVRIEFEDNWFNADSGDVPETKYGKKAAADKA
jgi:predicted dehydrogenase